MSWLAVEWLTVPPELVLGAVALVALLLEAVFWPRRGGASVGYFGLCGVVLALALSLVEGSSGATGMPSANWPPGADQPLAVGQPIDAYTAFFDVVLLSFTALCLLLALHRLPEGGRRRGESYPLLLFAALGMLLLASCQDLMVLLIGLELMSMPFYVLAAMARRSPGAGETAARLFVPGALGTCLLLYGLFLVYGAVGSTELAELSRLLGDGPGTPGLLLAGVSLVAAGTVLKVGVVPYGLWAPGLTESMPAPALALLASGTRVAGFAALGRLLQAGLGTRPELWTAPLAVLATAGVLVANLLALNQRDLKRLLEYSAAAQACLALLALASGTAGGLGAGMLLLTGSGLSQAALHGGLVLTGQGERGAAGWATYAGLGRRRPWLGVALALPFLSLAGLPPTLGLVTRFALLQGVAGAASVLLGAAVCVALLLGAYVHGRAACVLYEVRPTEAGPAALLIGPEALAVVAVAAGGLVLLGLWPGPLVSAARAAVIAVM